MSRISRKIRRGALGQTFSCISIAQEEFPRSRNLSSYAGRGKKWPETHTKAHYLPLNADPAPLNSSLEKNKSLPDEEATWRTRNTAL